MKTFFSVLIATWFGTGLIPRIPRITTKGFAGTWGSLGALPLCFGALWWVRHHNFVSGLLVYGAIVLIVFLIGGWSLRPAMHWLESWVREHRWRLHKMHHDQYEVVIDEVLGMLISCMPLCFFTEVPYGWGLGVAFIFFRLFDGTKLWPARYFDQQASTMAIIWDDSVAGVYTALVLLVVAVLFF